MIRIEHTGGWAYDLNFIEGENVGDLIIRFKDENKLHFQGNHSVLWTGDGHACTDDEPVLDNRIYSLQAWLKKAPV